MKAEAGQHPGCLALSVVSVLEDARAHSTPLHAFFPQSEDSTQVLPTLTCSPELLGYGTTGHTPQLTEPSVGA